MIDYDGFRYRSRVDPLGLVTVVWVSRCTENYALRVLHAQVSILWLMGTFCSKERIAFRKVPLGPAAKYCCIDHLFPLLPSNVP